MFSDAIDVKKIKYFSSTLRKYKILLNIALGDFFDLKLVVK